MQNRPVVYTILVTIIIILASALLGYASMQGWPMQLFPFSDTSPEELPSGANIAGWASLDRDSYLTGDIARYHIRVLWRENLVNPDLETFKNSIGFFPFNRREILDAERTLANDIGEYTLEYVLQAVDVEPSTRLLLPPPTVYYTDSQSGDGTLQSFRISPPSASIGSYYPEDVSEISLLELKGKILVPEALKQGLMFILGSLLMLAGLFLIWKFGSRRTQTQLSEPEQLWRKFHALDRKNMDNRSYLLACEKIFTGLFQYKTHISPMVFWSDMGLDEGTWKDNCLTARNIFSRNYLLESPQVDDVEKINQLLDSIFSRIVEEQRLQREQEPSFKARLLQQPRVLSTAGVALTFASVMFVLAARPSLLLSPDVARYNEAYQLIEDRSTIDKGYGLMSEILEQIEDERIKSAALYNIGTLATQPVILNQNPDQHLALLKVMFQEEQIFVEPLLHSLGLNAEVEILALFTDTAHALNQGEAALKAAIRLSPDDGNAKRNLEMLGKRRRALAETIQELLTVPEEEGAGEGELQRQTLVDLEVLMEMEMPDEYAELEEGKDNKDYFIMEGF